MNFLSVPIDIKEYSFIFQNKSFDNETCDPNSLFINNVWIQIP